MRSAPGSLQPALAEPQAVHRAPPAAVSLTRATEYGAVYPGADLEALCRRAKASGLGVHLDGARLANAAAAGFDVRRIAPMGVDLPVLGLSLIPLRRRRPLVWLRFVPTHNASNK